MTFGAQIKAARILLGWSQDQLSAISAVSVKTIVRAENAENPPSGLATSAIVKALEDNGITFMDDADGVGVKLRK